MQKIFGKWMDWMKGMKAKGCFEGADRLEDGGKVLRAPRGTAVTDGLFAVAKEVVGGFVIVSAANLNEAAKIAQGCPGLEHGTIVEVRPIEDLPHI
ncbi:MAG: transcription initiation protein [Opitutaceae bacterium]|nr:transcription initiation protein [Opitutaceae bacterium]